MDIIKKNYNYCNLRIFVVKNFVLCKVMKFFTRKLFTYTANTWPEFNADENIVT